jgi:hypothetical protein
MKIRMPHVFDGAARTLLVAGSLGIPASVLAQTASPPLLAKPTPIPPGTEVAMSRAHTAHVLEMKAELAWLADPVTSYCRLEARTVGSTLEVHGQVPSEADLAHALWLAREASGMNVVSKVEINPKLRAPASNKPQDALHREAFNALRRRFPEQAPDITLSTLADSTLVLKGTVRTYEEKLAISRHLRQATGCSCVRNQLRVLKEPDVLVRNSGAATLLPPERLHQQPIQLVADLRPPEPASPPSLSLAPRTSAPVHKSETPAKEASSSGQAWKTATTTNAKQPEKPVVYRTKWRRLEPSEVGMVKKTEPAAPAKAPVAAKKADEETPASKQHVFLRVIPSSSDTSGAPSAGATLAKADTGTLPKQPLPIPSSPSQGPVPTPSTSVSRAQYVMAPAAKPSPAAGSQSVSPAKKGTPYVADGVVYIESAFKPAAPTQPARGQKPPAIVRTGPYVTNGVILLPDLGDGRQSQANPTLAVLQSRLRQRIADVCGKASRDVEVSAVTATEVAVRVRANSTLEGEELSNRIMQLPELGPCQVSLDVLVMR